ncbi:MAG: phage major capsid protein [Pseudomonadota bacterium]
MPLTSNERLQETLSLALEQRSPGYQDLVSNANPILKMMKDEGMFKEFSGPKIRERLQYQQSGTYKRYSHLQFLNPVRKELFNDAEWEPKLAAVSVVLSGEDILKNSGSNQILDIMEEKIEAAEVELQDRFVEDVHSNGTAEHQIGGLQLALPTDPTTGTYGGISRADNSIWRPFSYDAHTAFPTIGTQVANNTIQKMYRQIMIDNQRGQQAPSLICASAEHFGAYADAVESIQRIQDENELGKLGFANLKFYGAGKSVPIVLEAGIGSAMPANTSYFVNPKTLCFRYHPDRNFEKFGGKLVPVNQDAVVQHIGWMGNITMTNSLFNGKLYDSNASS